jgi:hypothetical protein
MNHALHQGLHQGILIIIIIIIKQIASERGRLQLAETSTWRLEGHLLPLLLNKPKGLA